MRLYYRYQMMATLVSLLPLPLLLGIFLLLHELLLLPHTGLQFLSTFWKPVIGILILAIPSACGWLLAARAHFPPTFAAKFLPLLLPSLLYLSLTTYFLNFSSPIALAWYSLTGLAVALPYALFLLAFCFRNRRRESTRNRRKGVVCLLLTAAPFCAAFAFSLHSVLIDTVHGREDSIRDLRWDLYWGDPGSTLQDYLPKWADNVLALPSAPPSLRLVGNLPRLDGRLAALPLYAAAFQAVACLDEDGRLLSDEERDELLSGEEVECRGQYGWQQLADGEVDIFFGPPPSTRRLDELRARGLTPDVRPVAREALVFFVQKDNPVRNLSSEQLRRIYTGEITNWEDVGGRDERILPFQHEGWDENQLMLEELILRGEEAIPPLREDRLTDPHAFWPSSIVALYRKRSNALGFGLRWYLDKWFPDGDFRLLAVDGVPPTDATLRDGSYPLTLPLCMISCRPLDAESRAFRDWLLGPEGRDLIRRAGYLPWDEENDGTAENGGDTEKHENKENIR